MCCTSTLRERCCGRRTSHSWPRATGQAGASDATARQIVREHGAALGDYVLAAARQVEIEGIPFTLVLAGDVLRYSVRLLHEALIARVRSRWQKNRRAVSGAADLGASARRILRNVMPPR